MSGICGWGGFTGPPDSDGKLLERMGAELSRFDCSTAKVHLGDHCAVACAARRTEPDLYVCADFVVVLARLSHGTNGSAAEGCAETLARAFRKEGVHCLRTLRGSFALALIDRRNGGVLLAIDRMGIAPLYYSVVNGSLLFSSTIDAINLHPFAKQNIDAQALYDYVHFHTIPGPRTIYRGIKRLLPGHYLLFRDGTANTYAYWQMHFEERLTRPFAELKQGFRTVLRESVRSAADRNTAGAFLSGGTDSSTIAGLLGEVTGEPARTYSIGFEAQGYDEMHYARIAARHFGTRHHEYYVTPDDVVAAIPRIAAVHDQPFGNSSAVPTYYCAKLAKEDGIETLLGGDGGDELFGGNERYAKQYLYSIYSDLPRTARKRLIEPVAFLAPEIGLAGKVQRYIRHASLPMPARYDNYNLLERLGPETVFNREFLAAVDRTLPSAQMAQTYHETQAQSLINRMLSFDLKYTLADNDLPKVMRSCELAGIDVEFPMLGDAVVAFSAQLPAEMKLKGTQLRYFFKEALRGFLPDEIITKKKHGFGLPFGLWLQSHKLLQQIVLDSLTDLKRRHIVRSEFLDELTSRYIQSHADYYGTMAWVLMMLEQWFRQHSNAS
jgi:asparagine synthase (glutamine-hydrolysing)